MGEQSKKNIGQGKTNKTWSQKLKINVCKGKHLKTKPINLKARAYDWFTDREHYRPLSKSRWAFENCDDLPIHSAYWVHANYILYKTKPVGYIDLVWLAQQATAMFFACSTLLNLTELAEKVKTIQTECCSVKWAQNKQRSGTVSHMHNSRFADAEAGRTLNQLTTLRSSKLRADWPGPSKDGSPQSGGFPEGSSQLN